MSVAFTALAIAACGAPGSKAWQHAGETCFLGSTYVSESPLSDQVWNEIQTALGDLVVTEQALVSVNNYFRSQGKIAFEYALSCQETRSRLERVFLGLATRANSADAAEELRSINLRWREISEEEYTIIEMPAANFE